MADDIHTTPDAADPAAAAAADTATDAAAADKRRETRLRRLAADMGLALSKSRARDPNRLDYGCYRIVNSETGSCIAGTYPYAYSLTIDDVEETLEDMLANPDPRIVGHGNTPAHGCSAAADSKFERG